MMRVLFIACLTFILLWRCEDGTIEDQMLIDQGYAEKLEDYYNRKAKECYEEIYEEAALLANERVRTSFISNLKLGDSLPNFPDKPQVILKDSIRKDFRNQKIIKKQLDTILSTPDSTDSEAKREASQ